MPGLELIIMFAAMFAILYFLMIRPQKKRMQQHQATIDALQPGTRVLLNSGFFVTLSHIGERHAIVELAPGVEVTLAKTSIARVVTDEEEEFELTDEELVVEDEVPGDEAVVEEVPEPLEEVSLEFDPRPEKN